VFIKENINGQLAQISFASLMEEGKVGTQTNCIIKPGIESLGKDPILVQNLRSFGADCKCLQIYKSAIFSNLFLLEEHVGLLFCCFQCDLPEISEEDIDLIKIIAQAISIEIARLREKRELKSVIEELNVKNRRISLEMDIARTVHRSFLPVKAPRSRSYSFGFKFSPCFSVGGDYFDFLPFPVSQKMGVFFADISGHGVAGALLSSMLKMILFSVTHDCPVPVEVLSRMNQKIEENFPSGYFVSAFYTILDETTNEIEFANAAPEPALVLRSDGRIEIYSRGGQPMGLLPAEFIDNETFVGSKLVLEKGDKLIFFTDGLTDIKITDNARLGLDRVCSWLSEYSSLEAQQLVDKIYQLATDAAIENGIDDDIMLLAIARN
ncbi:MAG: GAF domain-containing SpoIIE family protein phosphatase, partial [Candidatus Riflebacteria bacterium]